MVFYMNETTKNILVVDDDPKIRRLLRNCFEPEGFDVFEAGNKAQIDNCLSEHNIHLITLDLNLGVENGLTIATSIRAEFDIPIIIVTGKGDLVDTVVGLEMGADDYISKPFHVREVIARVRSVLRRSETRPSERTDIKAQKPYSAGSCFQFNHWTVNFDSFELNDPNGEPCELTTADFKLLKVLLENPKRVLSRDQMMDLLNGNDWSPYDRTIDNQVARLRKKLEEDSTKPKLIKTVRGIGYTFAADVLKT